MTTTFRPLREPFHRRVFASLFSNKHPKTASPRMTPTSPHGHPPFPSNSSPSATLPTSIRDTRTWQHALCRFPEASWGTSQSQNGLQPKVNSLPLLWWCWPRRWQSRIGKYREQEPLKPISPGPKPRMGCRNQHTRNSTSAARPIKPHMRLRDPFFYLLF